MTIDLAEGGVHRPR